MRTTRSSQPAGRGLSTQVVHTDGSLYTQKSVTALQQYMAHIVHGNAADETTTPLAGLLFLHTPLLTVHTTSEFVKMAQTHTDTSEVNQSYEMSIRQRKRRAIHRQ